MARSPQFDLDSALDHAERTFRTHGYERTTINELCSAMRIGRSSLYAAFGDKRRLHLRCIARCEEHTIRAIRACLRGRSLREGLLRYLDTMASSALDARVRATCFFAVCADESGGGDSATSRKIQEGLRRVEAEIADALKAARERGEILQGPDDGAAARFLTAGFHGYRMAARACAGRDELMGIATMLLAVLDTAPPARAAFPSLQPPR